MGTLRGIVLIVGTSIGAGFLSGTELVRFFRGEHFLAPVLLSCTLFFFLCLLLLRLGKKYGGYENTVRALFKKASPVIFTAVFFLSFIPSAGMLAGLDALLPKYKPLLSALGILAAVLCLRKGTKGISVLNSILVPVLLGFVFFSKGGLRFTSPIYHEHGRAFSGGIVYAGMNVMLSAPVLMDAGKEMKRLVLPPLISSAIIAAGAVLILGKIYREGAGAITAEMPFLYVMRNAKLFSVAVSLAILTSLVSALYPLLTPCDKLKGAKKYAAKGVVLLAAFGLSRVGLSGIVTYFYPVIGCVGLLFSAFCIFNDYFFEKHHQKVHSRRKNAKNKRRAHHEVEL